MGLPMTGGKHLVKISALVLIMGIGWEAVVEMAPNGKAQSIWALPAVGNGVKRVRDRLSLRRDGPGSLALKDNIPAVDKKLRYGTFTGSKRRRLLNRTALSSPRSPTPGDVFMIAPEPVYGPAESYQGLPAVAFGGTDYLVVWTDNRHDTCFNIYGARVTEGGGLVDPAGFPISIACGDQDNPSIAFDGTHWLVVWQDARSGSYDIWGARVNADGIVLESEGILISNAADYQVRPSIAFSGANYLVVWADYRNGPVDIYGARVDTSGTVLDPVGIAICPNPEYQSMPSVAFGGSNYLVVWHSGAMDSLDICGARVDTDGNVLDPLGIDISSEVNDQWESSVAYDGANYLVTWTDERTDTSDIYGARVDTGGTVLDPSGIAISRAADGQTSCSVTFGETFYSVAWSDNRNGNWDIYGARMAVDGSVLDTSGIPVSTAQGGQYLPKVSYDGTNFFLSWQDFRGGCEIYGARVDSTGTVLDSVGVLVSQTANNQGGVSLSFDGANYFAVWVDDRAGVLSSDIYAARITGTGTTLDSAGVPISTATERQGVPSVDFDGANYLVAWHELHSGSNYDIYGARVRTDGTVIDSLGIGISTVTFVQELPSVTFGERYYLITWTDLRGGPTPDIYGARVDTSGTVLDTSGIAVSTAGNAQSSPVACFDGTNFLAVWEDARNWPSLNIYVARVDTAGTVLDTAGIPISTLETIQVLPSIAFDGSNYFVVWQDLRNGVDFDIYGARVSTDGAVLDTSAIAICTAQQEQSWPVVAFDGTNYFVVWQDLRDESSFDIYGARVDTAGVVLDPEGKIVSIMENDEFVPALVSGQAETLMVAWQSYVGGIYCSNRIFGKIGPAEDLLGVNEERFNERQVPISAQLEQNYPNPFYHATAIGYRLSAESSISIKLYDTVGRLVRILVNGEEEPGHRIIRWDGKDNNGRDVAAGVYFYQLSVSGFSHTRKMIVLR